MLLDCGVTKVTMKCPHCETEHHNVSVGEEAVQCNCGSVCSFAVKEDYFEYGWYSRGQIARGMTLAFNSDERNLN